MSLGYASAGASATDWASIEAEHEEAAYWAAQKAAEKAAAEKFAAAVEAAKEGDGFCSIAEDQPLPFFGGWLPGCHRPAEPISAEMAAADFAALLPRAEVAAKMAAAGERADWCAAWAERGYVGRANAPGGCNAQYRAFNEQAESLLKATAESPAHEAPEKAFTLADLAGLATQKKGTRK